MLMLLIFIAASSVESVKAQRNPRILPITRKFLWDHIADFEQRLSCKFNSPMHISTFAVSVLVTMNSVCMGLGQLLINISVD